MTCSPMFLSEPLPEYTVFGLLPLADPRSLSNSCFLTCGVSFRSNLSPSSKISKFFSDIILDMLFTALVSSGLYVFNPNSRILILTAFFAIGSVYLSINACLNVFKLKSSSFSPLAVAQIEQALFIHSLVGVTINLNVLLSQNKTGMKGSLYLYEN